MAEKEKKIQYKLPCIGKHKSKRSSQNQPLCITLWEKLFKSALGETGCTFELDNTIPSMNLMMQKENPCRQYVFVYSICFDVDIYVYKC